MPFRPVPLGWMGFPGVNVPAVSFALSPYNLDDDEAPIPTCAMSLGPTVELTISGVIVCDSSCRGPTEFPGGSFFYEVTGITNINQAHTLTYDSGSGTWMVAEGSIQFALFGDVDCTDPQGTYSDDMTWILLCDDNGVTLTLSAAGQIMNAFLVTTGVSIGSPFVNELLCVNGAAVGEGTGTLG